MYRYSKHTAHSPYLRRISSVLAFLSCRLRTDNLMTSLLASYNVHILATSQYYIHWIFILSISLCNNLNRLPDSNVAIAHCDGITKHLGQWLFTEEPNQEINTWTTKALHTIHVTVHVQQATTMWSTRMYNDIDKFWKCFILHSFIVRGLFNVLSLAIHDHSTFLIGVYKMSKIMYIQCTYQQNVA